MSQRASERERERRAGSPCSVWSVCASTKASGGGFFLLKWPIFDLSDMYTLFSQSHYLTIIRLRLLSVRQKKAEERIMKLGVFTSNPRFG